MKKFHSIPPTMMTLQKSIAINTNQTTTLWNWNHKHFYFQREKAFLYYFYTVSARWKLQIGWVSGMFLLFWDCSALSGWKLLFCFCYEKKPLWIVYSLESHFSIHLRPERMKAKDPDPFTKELTWKMRCTL